METKDTKMSYETKQTVETLNTKQYEEFVRQAKKEDTWSAFFCGVFGRNAEEEDEYSLASISTRTKTVNHGTSVDGNSGSK